MFNFGFAKLAHLAIHRVGNRLKEEGIELSEDETEFDTGDLESVLISYFLTPFKTPELFTFWHESDLELNPCFQYVRQIFADRSSFIEQSQHIAKTLYEHANHPKVQAGDLYISYFENCRIKDEEVDVIGIFKSESKDTFLKLEKSSRNFNIQSQEGVNIKKVDKGCLVFNTKSEEGFRVCIIDNLNSGEAQYWKDSFLKLKNLSDNYHYTREFMTLAKDYVAEQLPKEFEVSKADKIELFNRTSDYFKKHETFNKSEFEQEVFQEPELIQSFRTFNREMAQDREIGQVGEFEISAHAVRNQARIFKSVLKLDKNFHIYIHGNTDMIEKGVDADGRKYYKIYYKEEH